MKFQPLEIQDVILLHAAKHADDRGFFSETYKRSVFDAAGVGVEFVQDNHALSARQGTLRGLHFQTAPFAQGKLVRVLRGSILDVAVDIRVGSPTYGKYVAAEISAEAWNQIFVPVGFAHGLLTLKPDTEVLYKVSAEYSPQCDKGLRWNDPEIGIDWGIDEQKVVLSEKDKGQPLLAHLPEYFRYEG